APVAAEARVAGEAVPARAREHTLGRADEAADFSGSGDASGVAEEAGGGAGEAFQPGQEEWMNRDLGTRAEIEQTLDTPLDNVFTEEPAEAAARVAQDQPPSVYTEWGGG